ncbi:hypothetical protein T12_7849 [Trichinella patagoniensis]|uniref:Uncharacterized protein n=1 Tax=Trichinella patagoniensis TaxID=990121 RepID=A0A0V0ZRI4_9BILA|nr:hypothetical protein T12_7849 [Trichinella patagoniensis]
MTFLLSNDDKLGSNCRNSEITDVVALDFLVAYERFSGRIEDALILRICKIFQLVMMFRIAIRNSSVR